MTTDSSALAAVPEAPRPLQEWSSDSRYSLLWKLSELWRFRELLWALSIRSIKARYKQSVLGISWAIIQPFAMMVVFTVVFSKFAKVDTGNIPYPVFSYAALLPWQLFQNCVTKGTGSVVENGGIVKKIYFPREVCPLSAVLSSLVDFGVAAVMLVILMVFYRTPLSVAVLWLPLMLVIEIIFSLGIAFVLSAVNVFYRDIGFGLGLVMQVWMYACPVAYPISKALEHLSKPFQQLYMLNPMTPIIDNFRRVLVEQQQPDWSYLLPATVLSVLLMVIGYWYFKRAEGTFADVL